MVYRFYDKKSTGSGLRINLCQNISFQMNFINRSSDNLRKEKFTLLLKTMFEV